MQITVLGKSPSWQDADGACSGYLVQEGDYALLLDCGNGVFSKLRRFRDYVDVDAVLISHLHSDHFFDLVPFANALAYSPRRQRVLAGAGGGNEDPRGEPQPPGGAPANDRPAHSEPQPPAGAPANDRPDHSEPQPPAGAPANDRPDRPQLHAPPGSAHVFRSLTGCWGDADLIGRAFELREFHAADALTLGPFTVRFCEVPHFTRTYAVELANRRVRLTYSADCSPNEDLVRFARDTDLMLIEATLTQPERSGERGHMTPREAGDHGRRAGARRLVITHYSDELDAELLRAEAHDGYRAAVELAEEGATYSL